MGFVKRVFCELKKERRGGMGRGTGSDRERKFRALRVSYLSKNSQAGTRIFFLNVFASLVMNCSLLNYCVTGVRGTPSKIQNRKLTSNN